MNKQLESIFDFEEAGICIASSNKKVLFQNNVSKSICGEQIEKCCDKCSSPIQKDQEPLPMPFIVKTSSSFREKQLIADHRCDVYKYTEKNDKEFTVFYPQEKLQTNFEVFLKKQSLTSRELEIASLVVKKESNYDIREKLNITKATLKTHLNHIYKKVPQLKKMRENKIYHDNVTED